jgi:type II pantothenate kinase
LNQSELFLNRLNNLKLGIYKKAMIFVDNSGYDFILGILPFARYLLKGGTKVVLAANTFPSVNDITVQMFNDRLVN